MDSIFLVGIKHYEPIDGWKVLTSIFKINRNSNTKLVWFNDLRPQGSNAYGFRNSINNWVGVVRELSLRSCMFFIKFQKIHSEIIKIDLQILPKFALGIFALMYVSVL